MFDPILCESYVESLIHQDEVERALLVLENIPAKFRDNIPANLVKLKAEILAYSCTPDSYKSDKNDASVRPDESVKLLEGLLRGALVKKEVTIYNEAGLTPHIVEMGPGEYFIPIGLNKLGFDFTYWDIACNPSNRMNFNYLIKMPKPKESNQPCIFIAHELIEHLPSTDELVIEALRHCGGYPERVHVSTPYYTFDENDKDWRKPCGLPHLRAYTPNELINEMVSLFPGYFWALYPGQPMSVVGQRKDVSNKPLEIW